MAVPDPLVGTGSAAGNNSSHSPAIPSHAADDWALGVFITQGGTAPSVTWAGATELSVSPKESTSGNTGVRLTIYKKLLASSSETAPSIAAANHSFGVVVRVRGADLTDLIHISAGNGLGTASTAVSIPGLTTTVDEVLILALVARANDAAGAHCSGEANASLTSLTEAFDDGTATGNGGGVAIITGVKATRGVVDATTATLSASTEQARITLAIMPPQGPPAVPPGEITDLSFTEPDLDWTPPDPAATSYRIEYRRVL